MKHGITFGEKTTWEDWGLILLSQPVFNPPKQKTKILNPPGWDGEIDLSNAVTGHPVYENRTGSFTFAAARNWYSTCGEIMASLSGKTVQAILRNDPAYFFEGRFWVDQIKSDPQTATIVIDYSVGPYKWSLTTTTEGWLWDPFSFVDGVIYPAVFTGITIGSATPLTFSWQTAGSAPVKPSFTPSGASALRMVNADLEIDTTVEMNADQTKTVPGLILYGDTWLLDGKPVTMTITGNGELSIDFRVGRL